MGKLFKISQKTLNLPAGYDPLCPQWQDLRKSRAIFECALWLSEIPSDFRKSGITPEIVVLTFECRERTLLIIAILESRLSRNSSTQVSTFNYQAKISENNADEVLAIKTRTRSRPQYHLWKMVRWPSWELPMLLSSSTTWLMVQPPQDARKKHLLIAPNLHFSPHDQGCGLKIKG